MPGIPEEGERVSSFRRNASLEALLREMNSALSCAEQRYLDAAATLGPDYPILFVMGPLRSGTTLFMQWLAATGLVAVPTNLLSRFYGVPVVGAKIQLLLTDPAYNFRDELSDFSGSVSFASENGKTRGALSPNEFWYFWRRFLPFGEIDWLPDGELLRVVDRTALTGELTALTRVFGKPFALKSMILNYNIRFLDAIFEKALFVQMRRDPVTNVASILEARRRQLGSEAAWYSFKIPEYPQLRGADPITQSAGQLHYINKAVTDGMGTVAEARKLVVDYEIFCDNPSEVYVHLCEKIGADTQTYRGPGSFAVSRSAVGSSLRAGIESALAGFASR
jgi:hypothetical protein